MSDEFELPKVLQVDKRQFRRMVRNDTPTYEDLRQERVDLLNQRIALLEEIVRQDDKLAIQLIEIDTKLANNLSAMTAVKME